ncbi:MAG: DUF2304 domain-containing protein [Anaerolineales bacterium]|jgi:hypothetical protein|nr:DUF2304 domain-containing protein [Anaerolineales bacterium]
MIPFQAVLLVLILLLGIFFVRRSRSRLANRTLSILMALVLAIFVIFPDLTTWIANQLGIGRGTDFLFYTFALFVLYILGLIAIRLREQDRKLTQITRGLAIRDARSPQPAALQDTRNELDPGPQSPAEVNPSQPGASE